MLELDKLVSRQCEDELEVRSVLLRPPLRFIMLALSLAHSLSTYLLLDGATCLQRDEAAAGGAVDAAVDRGVRSKLLNSGLGVLDLEVKTEIASDKSGLETLKFSRDLAVSRLKLFRA